MNKSDRRYYRENLPWQTPFSLIVFGQIAKAASHDHEREGRPVLGGLLRK